VDYTTFTALLHDGFLRPTARASASPSSRLILGRRSQCFKPQAHGGSGWAGGLVHLTEFDRGRAAATFDQMAQSIAGYEARGGDTFDLQVRGKAQFTTQEQAGYALFRGKARCNNCHRDGGPGEDPLFTDFTASNIGTSVGPAYKDGGRPWQLADVRPGVCYVGLAYKRRDPTGDDRFAVCAAQMFLSRGARQRTASSSSARRAAETPNPLLVRRQRGDCALNTILRDVMGLTKINFNSCLHNDRLPVTIRFADAVGEIMLAAPQSGEPRLPFKFYI
jgi:mono/diheme cytochrome c family protein